MYEGHASLYVHFLKVHTDIVTLSPFNKQAISPLQITISSTCNPAVLGLHHTERTHAPLVAQCLIF